MSIIDSFDRGARINPDGPCLVTVERQYTYREIRALSNRIARGLLGGNREQGTKCGVFSQNDPVAYTCTLGILRAGMTFVPINPRNSKETNKYLLESFDCEVLFYHSAFHEIVEEIGENLPLLKKRICIDKRIDGQESLMEWVCGLSEDELYHEVELDAVALLFGTGGTTGDPKAAMQTHRNFQTQDACFLMTIPEKKPVMLVAAPLTHAAGGLTYHVLACGGTIIILPKPDPHLILSSIQEYKVTRLFLPPTVIYRLLEHSEVGRFDYRSLKYFLYGAAPMSISKLKTAIEIFGPVMTEMYGQSEAPGSITIMTPEEHFENGKLASDFRLSSCGRPPPLVKAAIMDKENRFLPDGETGEICARGDLVMKGYYKDPKGTEATIVNGWLHTGDLGFRDEQGYIHIVDRKKDMIITGGFNVYSNVVEQIISALEAVQDCAVIGVPDDEWGEAVKAVVELSPGKSITESEIITLCKTRLGSVKAPKTVEFVSQLPKSPVGKILKRELRDRYWEGRTRKV